MKNKKGFTLIELLVTIALMLSILGIAIISFINISNRRKEESWQKVKNQTEVAAEEYIKNNEYLISGKDSARISIGRLVSQDYLNVVVNPKTGSAIDTCDFVEIKKNENDSSYSYKYREYDGGACNADDYLSTSYPGSPSVTASVSGKKGNGTWFVDTTTIIAIAKTDGNGPIKEVKYCTSIDGCSTYTNLPLRSDNTYTIKNDSSAGDGAGVYARFVVTNTSGKTSDYTVTYNKDTVKPACNLSGDSTVWTNKTRTITWACSDKTSGCVKNSGSEKFSKSTKTTTINIEDKAGNKNSCSANVYVDVDKPTCSVSESGTKGNKVNGLQWYKSDVKMNLTYADTGGSGVSVKGLDTTKNSTNGKTSATQSAETKQVTWNGYVKDVAGNVGQCNTTFALEKNAFLSLNLSKTNKTTSSKNGKKIFNSSKTHEYDDTYSGNCKRKQSSNEVGCAGVANDNYYFGITCMYVGDYVRYFNVSSMSYSGGASYGGNGITSEGIQYSTAYYYPNISIFENPYIVNNLTTKKNGLLSFSIHQVWYTSPAGNKSNNVYLYTQYSVDCGY